MSNAVIFGVEILAPNPSRRIDQSLAIFHLTTDAPDLLNLLRAVAGRRNSPIPQPDIGNALPAWAALDARGKAFTVAFLSSTDNGFLPLPDAASIASWSNTDQWLWHLASRTARADFPPDPDHADKLLAGTVVLSADWRGLVTRDGAAFVGLRPDQGTDDPFFGFAHLYAHTAYLDALIIGTVQNATITRMMDEASRAFDAKDLPRHLSALEERTARFRNIYWLRDASAHGPANDILTAYQNQHHLPEKFDAVLNEIADLNRIVQNQESQRVNAALGIITVIGLPFGTSFAVLQTLSANSPRDLLIGALAALAGSGALLLTSFGRLLIRTLQRLD
ncbi:hypothetical protein [Parafrankia sp. BMG5.11]|uniref:hypothetical protein n=1 Tax=Parafrankia sp. BMG5.11 TaxID=222540 RepID=UPI00103B778D|nr:hypothetical protein [Parafrankia sp. BMG5.11]TCJ34590.1 hypothetical protein E0504_31785 [Parafrankia sp. BMG5.11]